MCGGHAGCVEAFCDRGERVAALSLLRDSVSNGFREAGWPAWVEFACIDCGNRKRVEVPIPDVRARVAAIELLLREGLGRPAQAEEPAALPQLPRSEAEARALDWEQLKALRIAYPELEYMPEAKRQQWLVSRWVGLTQAERNSFRAALDTADATRAAHSVV